MNSYFRWYHMDDDLCVEYAELRLGRQPITPWVDMTSRLRNKYVPRQYESMLFLNWLDLR
ncbi:unnamed protein product [Spirodela intermedia]|uniref:Uncharacterized protein n=1 Tax=Spirodela intermedia TaxID=51605 RepID=A0A7I8KUN4_SPIIN|nr:unnamed protein product [Spirodela intermedia]